MLTEPLETVHLPEELSSMVRLQLGLNIAEDLSLTASPSIVLIISPLPETPNIVRANCSNALRA